MSKVLELNLVEEIALIVTAGTEPYQNHRF